MKGELKAVREAPEELLEELQNLMKGELKAL